MNSDEFLLVPEKLPSMVPSSSLNSGLFYLELSVPFWTDDFYSA